MKLITPFFIHTINRIDKYLRHHTPTGWGYRITFYKLDKSEESVEKSFKKL